MKGLCYWIVVMIVPLQEAHASWFGQQITYPSLSKLGQSGYPTPSNSGLSLDLTVGVIFLSEQTIKTKETIRQPKDCPK